MFWDESGRHIGSSCTSLYKVRLALSRNILKVVNKRWRMATTVRMIEIFTFEEEKRSPQRIKKIDSWLPFGQYCGARGFLIACIEMVRVIEAEASRGTGEAAMTDVLDEDQCAEVMREG
ncbi:hypothetical protein U1Q18_050864 [Sarracenia purpurea var. burkii]